MNRVIHFEFPAEDMERAARFYSEAFGWSVLKWEGPFTYWLLMTGSPDEPGIDGALAARQNAQHRTNNTVEVADVEATLRLVQAEGGQVLMPQDAVPGVGWLAMVTDTEGNLFGLLQREQAPPALPEAPIEVPPLPRGLPRIVHFDFPVDDPARAMRFYERVLGWKFAKWDGPMDYWLITTGAADEPGIDGGMSRRSSADEGITNTLGVADLDAAVRRVTQAGGQVTMPRHAVPGVGWLAYCQDTEGNNLGLMQDDSTAA